MQLSAEAIKDFQAIYSQEFGEDLDAATAAVMARDLLALFQAMPQALPYDQRCTRCLHPEPSHPQRPA